MPIYSKKAWGLLIAKRWYSIQINLSKHPESGFQGWINGLAGKSFVIKQAGY